MLDLLDMYKNCSVHPSHAKNKNRAENVLKDDLKAIHFVCGLPLRSKTKKKTVCGALERRHTHKHTNSHAYNLQVHY